MTRIIGSLIIVLLVIVSCRKKVEWESNWVLPLFYHELNLNSLENDTTIVENNASYSVQLRRQLLDMNLNNFVKIPDTLIEYIKYLPINSLHVSPGFVFLNSIQEHRLDLSDLQLKDIHLSSGKIDFSLENPVSTVVKIKLILPHVSKDGSDLERDYEIPAKSNGVNGKINRTIDLSGYSFNLRGVVGNGYNILQSRIIVSTKPDSEEVTVTGQDGFVVKAKFHDIKLNYAKGYFGGKTFHDTQDFDLDIMKIIRSGSINLANTQIKFNIENGVKVDISAQLNSFVSTGIGNVAMSGSVIGNNIHIQSATGTGSNLQPFRKSIVFNSSNSNIVSFIENLGYKYGVDYKLNFNPFGNTTGSWNEIYSNSNLKIGLEVDMPLTIGFNQLILQDTIPFKLDMTKDKTHLGQGEVTVSYDNAFPIEAEVKIYFLDANNELIGSTNMNQPIPTCAAGTLFSNGLRFSRGELKIPFQNEIVSRIGEVKKIVISARLNSTDDLSVNYQMVPIPYKAFLRLKARAKFQLNTKF